MNAPQRIKNKVLIIREKMTRDNDRPQKIEAEWVKRREGLEEVVREKSIEIDLLNEKLAKEIRDHRETQARLKKALEEQDLLLREIYHRVNTNMQVISSLLNLQAKKIRDGKMLAVFKEAQNRVQAIILAHEILFQSGTLACLDLAAYLTRLASSLLICFGADAQDIRLKVNADRVILGINRAVPCGLVLNELITNSLKHAFPNGGPGLINIMARPMEEGEVEMIIEDDGVGMPEELDWRHSNTLGLSLVIGLVEHQLGGRVQLFGNPGARFVIRCGREADRL